VDDGRNPHKRPVPDITLNDFSVTYLDRYVRGQKSYTRTCSAVKQLCAVFGNVPMKRFTFRIIDDWKRDMVNVHGYSQRTVDRYLSVLKRMFSYALERGDVSEDANKNVKRVKKYTPDDEDVRYLSCEESQRLIAACDPHLRPVVIAALHTGMRRGELLKLRWYQVDFDNGLIRLSGTKSGKVRNIGISRTLRETLHSLPVTGTDYVFVNPVTRKPYIDVKRSFRAACDRAKITGFEFRNLRDTYASQLALAGAHPKMIQRVLGHATVRQTMKYINLADGEIQRAGDIIEKRLSNELHTLQHTKNIIESL
jgi:integrase